MSRVTKAALGALANAAGLDAATPQGRFRRVVRLAIPTGGAAQGATVAAGPVLDVTFLSREVEAAAPGAPEPATLSAGGAGLVLSLPVAREVARVRLKVPQAGDQIAAFRFDGAAVSEDATVAAAHGGGGAALNITDRALVLRRRNAGDHALAPGAIAGVALRYAPVNPRVLVAVVADPAGEQALPPATGAGGEPVFPAALSQGASLAGVLEAALGRLAEAGALPDPVALDIILEADQPCAARIDALDIGLRLERRGFAGAPGKRVLRFRGEGRETQVLDLDLPPAAVGLEGAMRVSVSGAPTQATARLSSGPPPVAGMDGLALTRDVVVAGRLDLAAAAVVVGGEIVVAATEARTVLVARLQADRDGRPDAVLVSSGEVALSSARPIPVPVTFAPTAVPAGHVWLALSLRRGAAVAMLGNGGDVVVSGSGPDLGPVGPAAGSGLAAALRFAGGATEAEAGLVLRLGDRALSAEGGVADLGPALASLPLTPPPRLALSVSAGFRAVVTLDPPVLRYGLQA